MNFSNPLFTTLLVTGIAFIIAGFFLRKFPPKNINHIYGYRTSRSMESQELWDFAQIYSAKELIKWGLISTCCSFAGLCLKTKEAYLIGIGIFMTIFFVFIIILRTEKALKSHAENFNLPK